MSDQNGSESSGTATSSSGTWNRRRFIKYGLGGAGAVVLVGAVGVELVAHGVLPGQQRLDELDGACSVAATPFGFAALGPSHSGTYFSRARNRTVGYTIAYPPDHAVGDGLALVVMLHGFGGNHTNALAGMSPAQAVALRIDRHQLAPMAMVTVDGGGGYWNPHPGDDPMAMVINELIPMCQNLGLGRPPQTIGTMGISMGGYGALLLAERYPHLISCTAAISPAIWTTYSEARTANDGAFASAEDFSVNNVIVQAGLLADKPVRVASGNDDPFRPGVETLAHALPPGAIVRFSQGCHTDPFFISQEPPSLQFLAQHLSG